MAYVQLPIRTSADLNSSTDINQLMENCDWLRNNLLQAGTIIISSSLVTPYLFLLCDGSSISRTTYSVLYNVITKDRGTVTISIASPGVVTLNNHGFVNGDRIEFTTTDTLPTGITPYTNYYTNIIDANTFYVCLTRADARAETNRVETSGGQSGTHSIRWVPYGTNGADYFLLPNFQAVVPKGIGTQSINTRTKYAPLLGEAEEDRIQNITGGFHLLWSSFQSPYGAFASSGTRKNSAEASSSGPGYLSFDASRVARAGDTTRDNSIGVRFFIKYE
jgi:microcystin-dependent protein